MVLVRPEPATRRRVRPASVALRVLGESDPYQSVLDGESQLGLTSTTDGTLEAQGLVLLEDDKSIQPAQNLVPAIGPDFLAEHPDIEEILNPLMAALTTENLTESTAGSRSTGKSPRTSPRTSWSRRDFL